MLDANTLIALLSGEPASVGKAVAQRDEGDVVVSTIAYAEVALGSWNGRRPSLSVLDQVARRIEILPFDHLAARYYAQLIFKRGSFDRLIAAHALSLSLTLVTNNERDFAAIPGLHIENWSK